MSRVGNLPVDIPNGVSVEIVENLLVVKGKGGELRQSFDPVISFEIIDSKVVVKRQSESKKARSMHGLYRKLLSNMVIGVSEGFKKVLEINGVGYRAELKKDTLILSLGYSMPIEYLAVEGVTLVTEGNNKVIVSGIDKAKVGQVAGEIRSLRPPEPYKGKGVKYEGEFIRRKVGKSGV